MSKSFDIASCQSMYDQAKRAKPDLSLAEFASTLITEGGVPAHIVGQWILTVQKKAEGHKAPVEPTELGNSPGGE